MASLIEHLKELETIGRNNSGKVFTMYLNTDPADPDQQGGKWKIMLKNGLHNFERYLQTDDDKEELKQFQEIKKKVEKYVSDNEQSLHKSIIIIASADGEEWYADKFHIRVKSDFYWQEEPELTQLHQLTEDYPKAGIILVQHNVIKVLESSLNVVQSTQQFELDLDTDDWKEKVGPRKGFHSSGLGSHNAQIDNFKARFNANKTRWYHTVAGKLDKKAKDGQWEKIYVIGESDVASELTKAMQKEADQIIHKNLLAQNEMKIMEAISEAQ